MISLPIISQKEAWAKKKERKRGPMKVLAKKRKENGPMNVHEKNIYNKCSHVLMLWK